MSIRMRIRPRLWRVGATLIYISHTAPVFANMWASIINSFVPTFIRIQKRENWTKVRK